ncbi:MAG: hypothetical protein GY769_06800 [bacterium]|nr:hypothetical protein [bacterium]
MAAAKSSSPIEIWFGPPGPVPGGRRYRVAEAEIRSSQPIVELEPFEISNHPDSRAWRFEPPPQDSGGLPKVYEGRGWIGGHDLGVTCRGHGGRYRLDIERGDRLHVWKDDGGRGLMTPRDAENEGARFAVLGPGLALALALGDHFSLHASAISSGARCFLILGDSGAGKSTLAGRARTRDGLERVADDVVPIALTRAGRVVALPRFPQLKLPASDQWRGSPRLPVAAVFFLRRGSTTGKPRVIELSAREAVLRLVENTVASRLFDAQLRERHLDVCVSAAASMRVADLEIPDDLDRLAETLELLESAPV